MYLGDAERDSAWEEAGRFTGLVEAFAREADRCSPMAARLVHEELLDPTREIRRKILARVTEMLPDGTPNL